MFTPSSPTRTAIQGLLSALSAPNASSSAISAAPPATATPGVASNGAQTSEAPTALDAVPKLREAHETGSSERARRAGAFSRLQIRHNYSRLCSPIFARVVHV